jgi:Ca2+-binding RTX toxin-like protein
MRERASRSLRDRRWTPVSRLLLPLLAIGIAAVSLLAASGSAGTIRGSARADLLRGTAGGDVLDGMGGGDRVFGYRGDDRIHGGAGADRLDGGSGRDRLFGDDGDDVVNGGADGDLLAGGKGRDKLSGGPGDDTIVAQDGARDVLACGAGRDTVHADRIDVVGTDCEIGRPPPPLVPPPPPPTGETVVLVDQAWTCSGPVNVDLVKVTMQNVKNDAIYLRTNCTGRIGRIEIETWVGDGVKVNAPAPAAHDLVIEGGYIRCHDHAPGAHQDGIQVMSGERITFRNLEINCNSNPNGQLFINSANGGLPTDVVCDRCTLGSGAANTLIVGESLRSGARRSSICPGRFNAIRINTTAESPVNTGNSVLADTDPRCAVP